MGGGQEARPFALQTIEHLIIRAPNWVGDLVMATPVLEAALKDPRFGKVSIALRGHLAEVLSGGPCADHLILIKDKRDETEKLRGADAVLLLSNSMGAVWRAFRAGVPQRAGSSLGLRRFLLTHRVVPPQVDGRRVPIPTAHLLRDVAGLFGIQVPSLHPKLHLEPGICAENRAVLAAAGLEAGQNYVLCAPGAAFGAAKLWPPEHHAKVLDGLYERHGWRGVVSGGPGEEAAMQAVVAACQHPAISLAEHPRSLRLLKPLVAGAELLLVGDSGPRWFAAAFDVPCVTLMGPNFPELTASSLEFAEVVRLEGLDCAPCLRRTCPLGHHRCMRDLKPEKALAAADRLLAARS